MRLSKYRLPITEEIRELLTITYGYVRWQYLLLGQGEGVIAGIKPPHMDEGEYFRYIN